MSDLDPLLSTGPGAKRLGVGRTKFLALVRSSRIPCVMLDGRIRVRASDIDAFKNTLTAGYKPGKRVVNCEARS